MGVKIKPATHSQSTDRNAPVCRHKRDCVLANGKCPANPCCSLHTEYRYGDSSAYKKYSNLYSNPYIIHMYVKEKFDEHCKISVSCRVRTFGI